MYLSAISLMGYVSFGTNRKWNQLKASLTLLLCLIVDVDQRFAKNHIASKQPVCVFSESGNSHFLKTNCFQAKIVNIYIWPAGTGREIYKNNNLPGHISLVMPASEFIVSLNYINYSILLNKLGRRVLERNKKTKKKRTKQSDGEDEASPPKNWTSTTFA